MIIITEEILKSTQKFKANLELYMLGKLTDFKSFGSYMGIYKERLKDTYMVRPRIPGGVISLNQLKAISSIARKYDCQIRFTTRQDIQFHSVQLIQLNKILDDLLKVGLTTKGAGGNSVRNVACSPLSGVAQDEIFDVTPYVQEVTNYLLINPDNLNLPRKYKVAFSNSPEDTANATIADIGFIAKIVDGKKGFEVYAGGGLGGGARIAIPLVDFIEDSEALYYVEAMREVFAKEGDRTNKNKARLRFVVQRLGEEKFKKLFYSELVDLKKKVDLRLQIDLTEDDINTTSNINQVQIDSKNKSILFPQKQSGYYSLYIHPNSGLIGPDDLEQLLDFLTGLDYKTSIRLTLTQGFFIRDLKCEDLAKLIVLTSKYSSIVNLENSICCVGPTVCNLGINHSQGLLKAIKAAFNDTSTALTNALPKLYISGCPNSCGQHQKGLIGLSGKRKRTDDGIVPIYSIFFNGHVGSGIANLGDLYGEIPAKKIPKFLLELAGLKVKSNEQDFKVFIESNKERVMELVNEFSKLEDITENIDLYSDYL